MDNSNIKKKIIDQNNDIGNKAEFEKPMTKFFKYYLFCFFSVIYLFYGVYDSFLGPALSDLIELLNTDSEHISYAWSFRNLTFCISTILASFSFKFFGNRQMQFGLAVLILGISCGLTPFLKSLNQFLAAYFFTGLGAAIVDTVTNIVVLEIFSTDSKVFMQLVHIFYTIGTIFGPLLIGPFLSKDVSDKILLNNTSLSYQIQNSSLINRFDQVSNIESKFQTHIKIPYLIASVLLIISSIFFMISQFFYPYNPEERKLIAKNKFKQEVNIPDNESNIFSNNGNTVPNKNKNLKTETVCQQVKLPVSYYLIFLGLTGLLLSIYSCIDSTSNMFMPSYLSKGELKVDKKDAAFMASVLRASMTTGRFVTLLLAFKFTCKNMLFFNAILVLLGYTVLSFFASNSKFLTWVSMLILGFGYSSTLPLIFSFTENRVIITNTVQLYLFFCSCIVQMFVPVIIGRFIDTYPTIFTNINLFLATATLIILMLIHSVDVWKKKLINQIKN